MPLLQLTISLYIIITIHNNRPAAPDECYVPLLSRGRSYVNARVILQQTNPIDQLYDDDP